MMKSLVPKTDVLMSTKRFAKTLVGKDFFVKPNCTCHKERLGSDYGGWEVAVDYIQPDAIVYSVGVGQDISFDIALMQRFGVGIHAFDPTPQSIAWVRQQPLPETFVLHEYGLADFDGTVAFSPPENPQHISHTLLDRPVTQSDAIRVSVKALGTIMQELGHDQIDLLKMDIEGAEYQVIEGMAQSAIRPTQVLIEFHHRFPEVGCQKTKTAIDQLTQMGYSLFAVSRTGEELSFILNEALSSGSSKLGG
jgi:FkbM family methyltransferase